MRVALSFKSPVLIGGKKSGSNFINSDDVIKGSVIRAAFAKAILSRCQVKDKEGSIKNWIEIKDEEVCKKCEFYNVCDKFGEIEFSYFYPEGSEVVPCSAKVCKTNDQHGYIDVLVKNNNKKNLERCRTCLEKGKDGKTDFAKGLRTDEFNKAGKKTPYKVGKAVSIKNAINPYSKTSADGMLYSVETIVSTGKDKKGKNKCVYLGEINNITFEELNLFKRLRVGGDTTVGLGKCDLILNIEKEDYIANPKEFSDNYKKKFEIEGEEEFVAIKFTGDLKVDFEEAKKSLKIEDDYISTDDYKLIWKEALGLSNEKDINISKIYTNFVNYRGYDTSKGNNVRAEIFTLAVKGTVIVFEGNSIGEIIECLGNHKSFGLDTKNGFGKYVLYDGR